MRRLRPRNRAAGSLASPLADEHDAGIGRVLEYGAQLMQAGCVLVIWEEADEPKMHEARWVNGAVTVASCRRRTCASRPIRNSTPPRS